MKKAELLRQFISDAVPYLQANPHTLMVYTRQLSAAATATTVAAFEYRYTLEVLVMDYPGDIDSLTVPIIAWARRYQPDLLLNPDRRRQGFAAEVDLLGNATMDILFKIPVDEAAVVTGDLASGFSVEHRAHAMPSPEIGPDAWGLVVSGAMVPHDVWR